MSGLLGLINLGGGAMAVDSAAIGVTGRNVANANTLGYQRQTLDLTAEPAAPLYGGVLSGGARRSDDLLLANRERDAAGGSGASGASSSALAGLERMMNGPSNDFIGALGGFYAATNALAASPTDPLLRGAVVGAASSFADRIRGAAATLTNARADSNNRITQLAAQASVLAQKIASANAAIGTSPDPVLLDQRDLAATQLSQLTGGQARVDPDGKLRFVLEGGAVLVDGDRAAQLTATPDPSLGTMNRLDVVDGTHVTKVTSSITTGQIGGELSFRDVDTVKWSGDLDRFANDFATKLNGVHSAYAGVDGVSGRNLFVPPAALSGAASALAVNAALVADPRQLASAKVGQGAGDNQGVLALISVRDTAFAGGGQRTPGDEAIRIMADLGQRTSSATSIHEGAAARASVLTQVRESISGVSVEEEMNRLSQFQQSHDAATKFVATVNQLLSDLIDKL